MAQINQRFLFAESPFARIFSVPQVTTEMRRFCSNWAQGTEEALFIHVDLYFRELWSHKSLSQDFYQQVCFYLIFTYIRLMVLIRHLMESSITLAAMGLSLIYVPKVKSGQSISLIGNTGNYLTINTIDVIIDTLRNQLLYKYLGVYPCFPNESHL